MKFDLYSWFSFNFIHHIDHRQQGFGTPAGSRITIPPPLVAAITSAESMILNSIQAPPLYDNRYPSLKGKYLEYLNRTGHAKPFGQMENYRHWIITTS